MRSRIGRLPRWLWVALALFAVAECAVLAIGWVGGAALALTVIRGSDPTDPASIDASCRAVDNLSHGVGALLPVARLGQLVPIERVRAWGQVPDLAEAAQAGCDAATVGLSVLSDKGSSSAGAALLDQVQANPSLAPRLGDDMTRGLDALDRVDTTALSAEPRLASAAPLVASVREQEPSFRRAQAALSQLSTTAPALLGADGPRTYLVMDQNDDELRATGGFIGTLGVVTITQGQITSVDFRSSYDWGQSSTVTRPAPEPLQRYMNFGAWYLRDANWWVDYREDAAQILSMWDQDEGNAAGIDGVIAVDQQALESLLGAVGPVNVPELGGTVTADTVQSLLDQKRTDATKTSTDYQRVKTEALSALSKAVFQQLTQVHGPQLLAALAASAQAADNRHILVWFRDPALQSLAASNNWDGRVDQGNGDFLGVVDSTISYGKVAQFLEKHVSYQRNGDLSVLTVSYRNHYAPRAGAPWDPLVDGTWWDWTSHTFLKHQGAWLDYVRALVPNGSQIVSSDGFAAAPTLSTEGDLTIIGGPLLVLPGETRLIALTYSNPTPANAPLTQYQQPDALGD